MKCLVYVLFLSLLLVVPSLALNNNSSINTSTLINNTSLINPFAQNIENIDYSNVNLTKENNYLNITNLSSPEYGIIESINTKISQLLAVNAMGIITIFLSILLFIIGIIIARHRENKKLEQFYTVKAYTNKLQPDDFNIKKYPDYIRKSSHDTIINRINEGEKKILVRGVTGLGKTRAVFEIIKELGFKTNYFVIIPTQKINLPISVPRDFFILKRKFILFFDDIDKYVSNKTEISGIINEFEKNSKNLIVLATCREEEYDIIIKKERIYELFDIIIEYDELSNEDGKKLAESVNKKFISEEFDGTAGSIVFDEHRKKEYYNKFPESEKNILRAIKLLSCSNISLPSEQLLVKIHETIFRPNDNFNTLFKDLKEKKFIFSKKDNVFCYDFYLSKIVDDYPVGNQLLEHMLELREVLFKLRSDENLFYLGNAFYFKEKYQDAITCYDKALEINPKDEWSWNNKGSAIGKLGKDKDGITCYDKALEINPKMDTAWLNKGLNMDKSGKPNEAITCYDKALEINPKNENAWLSKGTVLGKSGKHDEAIICCDKALEINPKMDTAWVNKGFVLDKSGKYDKALRCFDKALEINPNNEMAWMNKGIVLDTIDKYNEATHRCSVKGILVNIQEYYI